jgi:hypothetical protein
MHNCSSEKDSRARAEFDLEPIPDCNVKANVGRDFLFHEAIPNSENEYGYLRVTRTSMWWQQREFPGVWTREGLSFCMEKGNLWSNQQQHMESSLTLWPGPPLDLLRAVYKETQHQDRIEACGYRSPTWRVLRELKYLNESKVVIGRSAATASSFFDSAGRPSQPLWGPQQG